jgi:NAD(P)-dependent dehydrogenase (short-subunit alcohol dehydrogenase family)
MKSQVSQISKQVGAFSSHYDAIICAAGGFGVGSVKDEDVFEKYDQMDSMNFKSALLTAHLATKFLNEQGFLMFTGAATVFSGPVNYAFAYAMTKSATHALVLNIAEREDIPKSSNVVCILPTMIDTEANRKSMPD